MSLLVVAMLCYGLYAGGDTPIPCEISYHFPATMYSIINMISQLSGIIAPYAVGAILESNGQTEHLWNIIFFSAALVCLTGLVVFLIFGSAERQAWDISLDSQPNDDCKGKQFEGAIKH